MRRVFKSLICIVTSLVILTFSVVSIPVSAAITPEQEILNYCLITKKDYFEEGIPYLPSYFQNLNGWTNNKAKWTDFISKSVYPNRMYYTRVLYSGSQVTFYIINYDEITAFSGNVTFKNCVIATFSASGVTSDNPSMSLNVKEHINSNNGYVVPDLLATNYSGWVKGYVSFSGDGSTVTNDGKVLYEAMNESKDFGLIKGVKDILSKGGIGKNSLMDNSLVDVGIGDFDLLGSLVSGQLSLGLSSSLGIGVEVGDDTYNEIVADLSNNTTNSSYWNNIDASTKSNINTMYNNLKNSFDNSVKVYSTNVSSSSTGGDYYYMPSTDNTSNNNFSSWVSNGGDITEFFNKYINSFNTSTGDVTTAPGSGGSSGSGVGSGSGAYAEANASANAEGGNAEINQGDININIGGDTTSTSTSGTYSDFDDVNVSTLEKLLDSCSSFINWVGNVLKELPPEFTMCFTALLTVVIACRIMGR